MLRRGHVHEILMDATVLHEEITLLSIIGACVIFLGGAIAAFRPGSSPTTTTPTASSLSPSLSRSASERAEEGVESKGAERV